MLRKGAESQGLGYGGRALLQTQNLSSKPGLATGLSGGLASSLPPPLSFSFFISHLEVSGGVPPTPSLPQGLCKNQTRLPIFQALKTVYTVSIEGKFLSRSYVNIHVLPCVFLAVRICVTIEFCVYMRVTRGSMRISVSVPVWVWLWVWVQCLKS